MLEKLLDLNREVNFTIDGDAWRFQTMRPTEKFKRAQVIARILGNVPIESVTQDDYSRAFKIASLAVSYIEGPTVFVEKYHKDFSEIADDDYIDRLFNKLGEAEMKFDEAKKKFRPAQGSEKQ